MNTSKSPLIMLILIFFLLFSSCRIGLNSTTSTPTTQPQNQAAPLTAESKTPLLIPTPSSSPAPMPSSTPERAGAAQPGWETYQDNSFGFEIQYPPDSKLEDQSGEMRIFLPILPETNLSEKFLMLAARQESATCSGETYLGFSPDETPPETVSLAGQEFTKELGGDAGAGNIFNYISYSTRKENRCISLIFVLHSTNTQNYENPPAEYDWDKETEIIEPIVSTFKWK